MEKSLHPQAKYKKVSSVQCVGASQRVGMAGKEAEMVLPFPLLTQRAETGEIRDAYLACVCKSVSHTQRQVKITIK